MLSSDKSAVFISSPFGHTAIFSIVWYCCALSIFQHLCYFSTTASPRKPIQTPYLQRFFVTITRRDRGRITIICHRAGRKSWVIVSRDTMFSSFDSQRFTRCRFHVFTFDFSFILLVLFSRLQITIHRDNISLIY